MEGRKNWRLCIQDIDDDISDKVIVRVQGVLTKNNLVPKNARSCPASKAHFLAQSAEICGLRTGTFDASMANLSAVDQRFSEFLAGTDILGSSNESRRPGGVFQASNRVFTLRSDVPTEQDNAFQDGVDPMGAMARLKTGDLIHAPENIVKYFKRTHDSETKQVTVVKYEQHVPGGFHTGDIVEMQISFVAVTTGPNKVKITTRLQALTLLQNCYAKAALRRAESARIPIVNPAMRRKVGYFLQDDEDERKVKKSRSKSPEQ
ncbi:hypothetical protein B0H16DRAFT_1319409 [Mycena metata]|uniref:Uncharacterized protein n=1 Tax=Mycena metata TaxID=1033252 RepID=A0AAD7N8K8_9AGAR|nr:hypothetical protein B0H16DRAFT_1319409 [Mycena metata]